MLWNWKATKVAKKALAEIGLNVVSRLQEIRQSPGGYHTHTRYSLKIQSAVNGKISQNCDWPADGDFYHHVISFGNAKFGHVRSKLPSPSKQLLRHLRSLRKLRDCKVSIVMNDEYMTPQICAHCHQRTLKHAREPTSAGSQHGNQIHTVLQLSTLEHSVKLWCDGATLDRFSSEDGVPFGEPEPPDGTLDPPSPPQADIVLHPPDCIVVVKSSIAGIHWRDDLIPIL